MPDRQTTGSILSLERAAQSFYLYCDAAHCTPATLRWYRKYVGALLYHLTGLGITDAKAITPEHLRAFVERCHPHTFRRAFVLWSLRAGMTIYAVQQIMGHSNLIMLRKYLALVEDNMLWAARHIARDVVESTQVKTPATCHRSGVRLGRRRRSGTGHVSTSCRPRQLTWTAPFLAMRRDTPSKPVWGGAEPALVGSTPVQSR
jgi:hypothetical protein